MPPFAPEFLKSTLALLGMTWLGVAGLIDEVEIVPQGLAVRSSQIPSFALGDVAYHGYQGRDNMGHELGHLQHEDQLGALYAPVSGLASLIGNLGVLSGRMSAGDYYGMWTEREADRLGGVTR